MASVVTPIPSLKAARLLNKHSSELGDAFKRLSSGLRINSAKDDASGLAVAEKLKVDSKVFSQAIRNANDAVSSLQIADGALTEMGSIVSRLQELSQQSANGILTLQQRKALDSEAYQLTQEYNRIINTTKFNGTNLLTTSTTNTQIQLGYGSDSTIGYLVGADLAYTVGTGTFSTSVADASAVVTGGSMIVNDMNGDGKSDAVTISNAFGLLNYHQSNGDGTFTTTQFDVGATITGLGTGDFNNDGISDIIATSNGTTYVYAGQGGGTFSSSAITTAAGIGANAGIPVISHDVNGDGNLDIISGSGTSVSVALGNGTGGFGTAQTVATVAGTLLDMKSGDFNGDGLLDFATTNSTNTTGQIFLGGSGGSFSAGNTFTVGATSTRLTVGDVNNDGFDDIATATGAGTVTLYTADASGAVSSGTTVSGITATRVVLGDTNGDGNLDLVGTGSSTFSAMTGDGNGNFTLVQGRTSPITATQLALGDYNGDGAKDIFNLAANNFDVRAGATQTINSLPRLYLLDQNGAESAISFLSTISDRISNSRGKIGANLARMDSALANLESAQANSGTAYSRITDADIANETARLVRTQALQQATSAVLAQANISAQRVLDLLGDA